MHIVEFSRSGYLQRIIEGEKVKIKPHVWLFENGNIVYFNSSGEFMGRDFFKQKELNFPESSDYFQA